MAFSTSQNKQIRAICQQVDKCFNYGPRPFGLSNGANFRPPGGRGSAFAPLFWEMAQDLRLFSLKD